MHTQGIDGHHVPIMSSSDLGGLVEDFDLPKAASGTLDEFYKETGRQPFYSSNFFETSGTEGK